MQDFETPSLNVSVAIEMEVGHPGHHGDSAVQLVEQASSCASVLATTLHPDTVVECVWDRAGMRGEDNPPCVNKVTSKIQML